MARNTCLNSIVKRLYSRQPATINIKSETITLYCKSNAVIDIRTNGSYFEVMAGERYKASKYLYL